MKLHLPAAAVLAAFFVSSAAEARDGQAYVGVEAGVMLVNDIHASADGTFFNPTPVAGDHDYFKSDLDTGFDVDFVAGYDFGHVRAELELGYRRAGFDHVQVQEGDLFAGDHKAKGSISSKSAMINILADVPVGGGFNLSAGPGIGWAAIKADPKVDLCNCDGFTHLQSHKASGVMVQGIAGIRKEIGKNLDVGVKYRFIRSSRSEFDSTFYSNVRGRMTAHSILASLTYSFGL
jgi:OmpA-OmpF porin, OOP family